MLRAASRRRKAQARRLAARPGWAPYVRPAHRPALPAGAAGALLPVATRHRALTSEPTSDLPSEPRPSIAEACEVKVCVLGNKCYAGGHSTGASPPACTCRAGLHCLQHAGFACKTLQRHCRACLVCTRLHARNDATRSCDCVQHRGCACRTSRCQALGFGNSSWAGLTCSSGSPIVASARLASFSAAILNVMPRPQVSCLLAMPQHIICSRQAVMILHASRAHTPRWDV